MLGTAEAMKSKGKFAPPPLYARAFLLLNPQPPLFFCPASVLPESDLGNAHSIPKWNELFQLSSR